MELGLEPSALINSSVGVLSLLMAFAAFVTLRMINRLQAIQARLSSEDVPDRIRNSLWFFPMRYAETVVYIAILIFAILGAYAFINLVADIINYYYQTSTDLRVEQKLAIGVDYGNLFSKQIPILFGISFLVALVEFIPSVPFLPPTLGMYYFWNSRGSRVPKSAARSMLLGAKSQFEREEFMSAILLAGTSVEALMRTLFDPNSSMPATRLVEHLEDRLNQQGRDAKDSQLIIDKVKAVRRFRNSAAHPGSGMDFTREKADQVIKDAEWLLEQIE